jgi:FlaA1/EpsC-like NDP-sugar epimerase
MIERMTLGLLGLDRGRKRLVQVIADIAIMMVSFAAAMVLRLESFAPLADPSIWLALAVTLPISLYTFIRLGFYRAVIRYISLRAAQTVAIGVLFSAVALFLVSQLLNLPVPRSVPVIYALLATCLLGGIRMVMRRVFGRTGRDQHKVIIYGAGASGRQLQRSLDEGEEYTPVAFVDDAPELQGADISGLRVHSPDHIEALLTLYRADVILLAMPSASRSQRQAIMTRVEKLPVRVQTIPGVADLVSGRARVSELRDVAIEDLLGRDPVPPEPELMAANLRGKVVMVTGAGGSIGSELCRQIIDHEPQTLILWELSELALYSLDMELREQLELRGSNIRLVPLIGSVQNPGRVEAAMQRFGVQTVYHAAAYKHVPMVEHNVVEGLRNNVFGTKTLVDQAIAAGVEAFILISTDKAVRPTNVMGASKRLAELVCQAAAARNTGTVFSMVRFGNVLGSSGSVIPRFRAQVEAGGPVTVTHPEITRYFMTIPEAAQLVIQAGAMAKGGDVFVLDMGEPIRIADLAERIVRLCGLEPYHTGPDGAALDGETGDVAITYTGLRPGEKLYEELLIGEASQPTHHPRILTATEQSLGPDALETLLDNLLSACKVQDVARLRKLIAAAPTGYRPDSAIADLLWEESGRQAELRLEVGE